MTFPYLTAQDLENELESTAERVRRALMYGDECAEPIDAVIEFMNANWQRLEEWVERSNEPDDDI